MSKLNFKDIYAQINQDISNQGFDRAYELVDDLFASVSNDEEKLYAHMLKINLLTMLQKKEELFSSYDALIEDYKDSKDEESLYYVAFACFNKAIECANYDEHQEAVNTYDLMIKKFENTKNPDIYEFVVKAYINKASRLNDLDKKEEALLLIDEVYEKFKDEKGENLTQVAISLNNKAAILDELGREKELKEVCELIVDNFSHIKNEIVQNIVGSAEVLTSKDKFSNNNF